MTLRRSGGRRAKVRLAPGDIVRDAGRALRSRPGRTLGLGLTISLSLATFVGVLSLSDASALQVQRRIDAHRPDVVRLTPYASSHAAGDLEAAALPAGAVERIAAQPDLLYAATIEEYPEPRPVRARWGDDGEQVERGPVLGVEGDLVEATRSLVSGSVFDDRPSLHDAHVAVVGARVADRIGLADPEGQPTIWIDGVPFLALGVLEDSEHLAYAIDAVMVPAATARAVFGDADRVVTTVYARVERGTADTAAELLPLRLTPQHPERWDVVVPRVPLDVAEGISQDLKNLTLGMAGLVMVIGAVGIANALMRSVFERTAEIGLRRSLGARANHVFRLFVTEAALIGLVAGVIGAVAGALVGMALAVYNGWPASVSLWAFAVAVPAAVVVGSLGGLLPAATAVRITPAQALRQE